MESDPIDPVTPLILTPLILTPLILTPLILTPLILTPLIPPLILGVSVILRLDRQSHSYKLQYSEQRLQGWIALRG